MNNPQTNGQGRRPPDLNSLIKPDQVGKLPFLNTEAKQKYHAGISNLWANITQFAPESREYQGAYAKLVQVTGQIMDNVKKHNAGQQLGTQVNGARPASAGQQGISGPQAQQRQQGQSGQHGQPGQQGQQSQQPSQQPPGNQTVRQNPPAETQPTYSIKVREQARNFAPVPPPTIQAQGPQVIAGYVNEQRNKYASNLHKYEMITKRLEDIARAIDEKRNQGTPTPNEEQIYQSQKQRFEIAQVETRNFLRDMLKNNEEIKTAMGGGPMRRNPSGNGSSQGNAQQEHQGQPHSVSSALDAARSQADAPGNPGSSQSQVGQVTNATAHSQPTQNQAQHTQPNPSVKNETAPPQQRVNSNLSNAPSNTRPEGQAYPLSHETAVQQARSYSNPNNNMNPSFPQNPPQSATHSHPSQQRNMGNEQQNIPNTHSKMPIPKDLNNIPPPQPVSMGQSRPTMTNGPNLGGPIGQPVVQKHPGYVLEGEGERVLSKKRLEELVRQVTGSTGNDGVEGETMSAEVEETLLEVADNFVDEVIVSACKLAKLRNSSTLDLRDLQLILERNYNIRVPGFASDEVRAVRKVVPTTSWTQKLSAVQAAKVTGGRGE